MLRKLVTGHGDFIAKQLRLQKGTLRTCLKLFIAFLVSGVIHDAAEYVLYQKWAGHSIKFFLLQVVAIICEGAIITLATKAGLSSKPNSFVKFIGFVWVFTWFTYCLPLWLDQSIHEGTMDDGLNFSLILGLWRGDWTPSRANWSVTLKRWNVKYHVTILVVDVFKIIVKFKHAICERLNLNVWTLVHCQLVRPSLDMSKFRIQFQGHAINEIM